MMVGPGWPFPNTTVMLVSLGRLVIAALRTYPLTVTLRAVVLLNARECNLALGFPPLTLSLRRIGLIQTAE